MKNEGYKYIPAALGNDDTIEIGFILKPIDNTVKSLIFKKDNSGYRQSFKVMDRDVVINYKSRDYPLNKESFDFVINLDPFKKGSAINYYLNGWGLYSAGSAIESNLTGNWTHSGDIKLLGDSGGYQLKVRQVDYIDPLEVINWYNGSCDAGMALDAAPDPDNDHSDIIISKLAHIQANNNQIFAENAREDLKLLNVVQGFTPSQTRYWIKTVKNDRFNAGWAVPSNARRNIIKSCTLINALIVLLELKEKNWIHIFGMSNQSLTPVIAWLGRYVKLITSDSSSWQTGSQYRNYSRFNEDGKLNMAQFKTKGLKNNITWIPLQCSCPICSALGYKDILMNSDNKKIGSIIKFHNLIQLIKYSNIWSSKALSMTFEEYSKLVNKCFGEKIVLALDCIEHAIAYGVDSAAKEYGDLEWDDSDLSAYSINSIKELEESFNFEGSNIKHLIYYKCPSLVNKLNKVCTNEEIELLEKECKYYHPKIRYELQSAMDRQFKQKQTIINKLLN